MSSLFKKLRASGATAQDDRRRPSILLVDDEPSAFFVLSEILKADYNVHTAASGEEGLDLFRRHKLDLVITDQRMPGMSGVELLRRTMDIDASCIRIILTAYPDIDVVLDAVNSGQVYGFVIKPWDPAAMRATVRRAIEHRDMIGANHRLMREVNDRNDEVDRLQRDLMEMRDVANRASHFAGLGEWVAARIRSLRRDADAVRQTQAFIRSVVPGAESSPEAARLVRAAAALGDFLDEAERLGGGGELGRREGTCDAAVVARQAVAAFQSTPAGRQRQVVADLGEVPSCPMSVSALRHALDNLLSNAAHATPPGGQVHVFVRAEGGSVLVAVADNGCGIPRDRLGRVWAPGYSTRPGAQGLGLSIVRGFVEGSGGTIACDSEEGRGTVFTILLAPASPADRSQEEAGGDVASSAAPMATA
jgi:signal transduction histidine kinase